MRISHVMFALVWSSLSMHISRVMLQQGSSVF